MVVTNYSLEALTALRERLVRAISTVADLCNKAAALHNMSEYARLDGKREGLVLALSYLDEEIGA